MGYEQPADLDEKQFHCAACRLVTEQEHYDLQGIRGESVVPLPTSWAMCRCAGCGTVTLFFDGEQIIPPRLPGQFELDGLPEHIAAEIRCALATLICSPRASAAHARTALYAMLADVAARESLDACLPADTLFARLVPAQDAIMHAYFRDTCLRAGTLVPAGVQQPQEPSGTASALLDALRLARDLFYPLAQGGPRPGQATSRWIRA